MTAEQEPTLFEIEAAITLHAGQAARRGRAWREYVWTHEEINRLLDERDRVLNQMADECRKRSEGRLRWWRGVGA